MKRFLCILFVCILAVCLLTGCGKKKAEPEISPTVTATDAEETPASSDETDPSGEPSDETTASSDPAASDESATEQIPEDNVVPNESAEDLSDPDVQSFYQDANIIDEFVIEYGEDQELIFD